MRQSILLIFLFFAVIVANAQTGIGINTPNASAKLDVYSTNKGFLPPRVTLTSISDATTIATPAEGLLVYNLGSVGLQAGYYYWNGANWATIATATSAGNGVTSSDMVKLYSKGYSNSIADSTVANASGYKFTVPVSGRYLFDFSSTGYSNATTTYKVRQGTTDLGTDAQTSVNNSVHVEYNGKIEVNLQAGVTYNVYVNTTGLRDAGDYDRVYYKMVAGNLPVTGQTVDYGLVKFTGTDTGPLTAGAIVPLDATLSSGNITWSGNKFTLKANKTYELESYLAIYQSTGWVAGIFQIYDYTNSTALGNGFFMSMNGVGTNSPSGNGPMKCIVTPTADMQVGIKFISFYGATGVGAPGLIGSTSYVGSANAAPNQCYFVAKQIGSSAIINPWTLSGTNTYNTLGKVGIGNTAPNANLDVRSSPTSTTDPGAGFIGIGTTTSVAAAAGIGALRFNTSNGLIEFSNGISWLSLAPGNAPMYAQFRANAYQVFNAASGKMNFPNSYINVGGFTITSSNTITLPAGRIYRIDLNLGWASLNWARFAIYNATTGIAISATAHLEGAANGAYSGSGTTTTFVDTTNGSIIIDVRYVAPAGTNAGTGDTGNGTNFPSLTIQAVD